MEISYTNSNHKPIVLLVDDDEEDRMLMRMALESMQMAAPIQEFDSGERLLNFMQQETDQSVTSLNSWIVILDKYMPGLSGFDTLRKIKENPLWERIPVVLFVNTQNQDEMELCIDLGATVCISKPLYFDEIKELMREVYQHWLNSASASSNK
ncbi:two-component response regulator (ARR-A family) [Larkinella arboricola]|uniref:Two-component response regulator (ARR-A family) n=1 Tax=Larkinella arboricola TaxID=643671 RepID=A0A327X875_LARAB|nr:response regulator [Larkinella arboricola]RAK02418.1 two-component response regulator (ARR-A family) [Larkinella arboricola]